MTRLNWDRATELEGLAADRREQLERMSRVFNTRPRPWFCVRCGKRLSKKVDAALVCWACRQAQVNGN